MSRPPIKIGDMLKDGDAIGYVTAIHKKEFSYGLIHLYTVEWLGERKTILIEAVTLKCKQEYDRLKKCLTQSR